MDECAVWFDSSGNTTVEATGRRTVGIKTTGHEKANVTVCLTVSASGQKFMPILSSREEVEKSNDWMPFVPERYSCPPLHPAGWIRQQLRTIPHLAFGRQMIVWDSFRCLVSEATKTILRSRRILNVIIPGG